MSNGKVIETNYYINITLIKNRGAAFGLLKNKPKFLKALVTLILAVITYYYFFIIYDIVTINIKIGFALVISGAIGNLIDRYVYGYVIDYIYFKFKKCPIFNIADISIFIGVVILLIGLIKENII